MSESISDNTTLLEQANELKEILELIPNDISTLNSLIITYLQANLTQQAAEYAIQIRQVLMASGEDELLEHYADNYIKFSDNDPLFTDIFTDKKQATINISANENIEESNNFEPHFQDLTFKNDSILDELTTQLNRELEFAEYLKREDIINAEQCDMAIEQLIADSGNMHSLQPLTIMQQLSTLDHINILGIIGKISHRTSVPYISLSNFKHTHNLDQKINNRKAQRLGVAIFSEFEGELMVACLNPVDSQLKYALNTLLDTNLHFYLTSPSEISNFYK